MMDFDRRKMQDALTDGFLTYVVQSTYPTVYDYLTAEKHDQYRNDPLIHRKVQVLYESGQPIDHPVILNFPESEYLKGFILRMQD